jgi:5'-nucleotidase (lipoprotein e(P4) family)
MKFKIKPILPILLLIAVICSSCDIYFQKPVLEFTKKNKFQVIDPYIEILQNTVDSITKVKREKGFTHIDYALLWVANSAEYKALCYQAYNLAKLRLDQRLSSRRAKKPAIVLDLDETVLSNLPYYLTLYLEGDEYSEESWDSWVEHRAAEAIPGTKEFLDYAKSCNVEIFYISNRSEKSIDATFDNIAALGLPITRDHLLLKNETDSKETRREVVRQGFDIILLVGDNLIDFNELFDKKPTSKHRDELVTKNYKDYGDKFIMLPNPLYGQWFSSLLNYDYSHNPEAKFKITKQSLLSLLH